MWTRMWDDHHQNQTFSMLDGLRRRMDLAFGDMNAWPVREHATTASWPLVNLYDVGEEFVLEASVPGLEENALEMTATAESLTLSGKRMAKAPEGYVVHRQERGDLTFARSFTLPTRIDPEKVSASLERGVLTVRMAKAAETKPRQITVKSSA